MKKYVLLIVLFSSAAGCQKSDTCVAVRQPDCLCTYEYNPVCGCDAVTYGNACVATCSGILNYVPGPCK
ncbi:MAG: hypothetical protein AAFO94_00400 [Bacteroidota bacterium]